MKSKPSKDAFTTYVALLRGINVGGNNIVGMAELKACFESLGFRQVKTYINSGNVIFKSGRASSGKIVTRIEDAIKARFGLEIRVIVRTIQQVKSVAGSIPAHWTNDASMKTDVLFLWDEVNTPDVLSRIVTNPKVDNLVYKDGAVVWNVRRADYKKSGMHKFIGTGIYKQMTARNVNTARKIYGMMQVCDKTSVTP